MDVKSITAGTPEEFNVIIEIPHGSSVKYEYDEKLQAFRLDFIYQNITFPFNYGFVPHTLAEDGDPLDVMVIASQPLFTSSVVVCKAVAMAEVLDRGVADNKIIAVPIVDPEAKYINNLEDLSEELLRQFQDFWQEAAVQKNKIMEVKGFHGKTRAMEEIKKSLVT